MEVDEALMAIHDRLGALELQLLSQMEQQMEQASVTGSVDSGNYEYQGKATPSLAVSSAMLENEDYNRHLQQSAKSFGW